MPHLIVLVLTQAELCQAVVRAWEDVGVAGATIVESVDLLDAIPHHAPRDDLSLMPSLRAVLEGAEGHHRTLFSVVADGFDLDELIAKTEEVIGGFDKADHGRLFVVPVTRALGVKPGRPTPSQESLDAR
jgi:hypothetical protein